MLIHNSIFLAKFQNHSTCFISLKQCPAKPCTKRYLRAKLNKTNEYVHGHSYFHPYTAISWVEVN